MPVDGPPTTWRLVRAPRSTAGVPLGSSTRISNLAASSIPNRRGSRVTSRLGISRRHHHGGSGQRRESHPTNERNTSLTSPSPPCPPAAWAIAWHHGRRPRRGRGLQTGAGWDSASGSAPAPRPPDRETASGSVAVPGPLLILLLLVLLVLLLLLLFLLLVLLLLVLLLFQHLQRQLIVVLGTDVVRVRQHRPLEPLEGRLDLGLLEGRRARVEGGIAGAALGRLFKQRLRGFEPTRGGQRRPEIVQPVRRLGIEIGRTGKGVRRALQITDAPVRDSAARQTPDTTGNQPLPPGSRRQRGLGRVARYRWRLNPRGPGGRCRRLRESRRRHRQRQHECRRGQPTPRRQCETEEQEGRGRSEKDREPLDPVHRSRLGHFSGPHLIDRGGDLVDDIRIGKADDLAIQLVGDRLEHLRVGPGHHRLTAGIPFVVHPAIRAGFGDRPPAFSPRHHAHQTDPCLLERRGGRLHVSLEVFAVGKQHQNPPLALVRHQLERRVHGALDVGAG